MKKTGPIVNNLDKQRLEPHLASAVANGAAGRLRTLLERAAAVAPPRVPGDIVTMNTRLVVRDPHDDEADICVLVYPDGDAPGAISVLSPLGSALLAAREGEIVEYMGARTARKMLIESIQYQPERAGDYEL